VAASDAPHLIRYVTSENRVVATDCRTDRGSVALDQTAEYVAGQCLDRDGYAKLAQQRRVRSLDGVRRTSCEAIQHVGTA
jgi:precorrin-6x reductase